MADTPLVDVFKEVVEHTAPSIAVAFYIIVTLGHQLDRLTKAIEEFTAEMKRETEERSSRTPAGGPHG